MVDDDIPSEIKLSPAQNEPPAAAADPVTAVPLVRRHAIIASLTALGCTDRTQVTALLSRAPVFARLSREEISAVLDSFLPKQEFPTIPTIPTIPTGTVASASRECEG